MWHKLHKLQVEFNQPKSYKYLTTYESHRSNRSNAALADISIDPINIKFWIGCSSNLYCQIYFPNEFLFIFYMAMNINCSHLSVSVALRMLSNELRTLKSLWISILKANLSFCARCRVARELNKQRRASYWSTLIGLKWI